MSCAKTSKAAARPVTYAQASLYFAEEKAVAEGAYNIATKIDVRGPITDRELVGACRRLTCAIPALRVRMGIDEWTGEVVSWFAQDDPSIELNDCDSDLAAGDALIEAATRRPFDVDEGALNRYLLVRVHPELAIVVMVAHHLIMDGLSHARLTERFARCLTESIETDDPGDYVELVDWIRGAEAKALQQDRDYWFNRIPADVLSAARLPRDDTVHERVTRHLLTIETDDTARLNAMAEASGASLFRMLMAVVHRALPPRESTRSLLCAAASQRPVEGTHQHVIGCFVNMVPLAAHRFPGESAWDMLGREAPGWGQDVRHRHFPFVELAQHVDPGRRLTSRLDSVMVGYRRTPRAVHVRAAGIDCTTSLNFRYMTAKTELSVRFFDYHDQIDYEVQWSQHLPDKVGEALLADLADRFASCSPIQLMQD
jgi:Condensation domain